MVMWKKKGENGRGADKCRRHSGEFLPERREKELPTWL
jgi:hypothetical protein